MNLRLLLIGGGGLAAMVLAAPGGRAVGDHQGLGFASGQMVWPVSRFVLTQGFGCTDLALEPVLATCPGGHFHAGLDLAAPAGTPVRAAGSGLVAFAASDHSGYGLHVVLDHGGGVTTLYGHLLEAGVRTGQLVVQGQEIGEVGSTGNSTGPHLHFEVRAQGHPTDPETHLPARTLRGALQ